MKEGVAMPVYKDEERKTWYVSFYYTDWTGERKRKLKRGFKRERDAKEYEREFIYKYSSNLVFRGFNYYSHS